jgi:thioredoxin reductase (NADPH)
VDQFLGRGVHYGTATDAAPSYHNHHVVVLGGANSAGQAALHLANYAQRVTMVVRADSLARSMSTYLVDRIQAHERIAIRTRAAIVRALGASSLERVVVTGSGGDEVLDAMDPIAAR